MKVHSIIIMCCIIACTTKSQLIELKKRHLKILFMVDKFPYEPRKYIDNQIVDLIDQGHEVYILADRINTHASYEIAEKYNFIGRTIYGDQMPANLSTFDIIYCQFGWVGNKALRLLHNGVLKGKLIVCFRGGDATTRLTADPHLYDQLFKKADLFLPVCASFKKILVKKGCDPRKIKVHFSAIDLEKYAFVNRTSKVHNDPIRLITVSRLVEYKGIEDSILAVIRVMRAYPNIRYEIIGEGLYKEKLHRLITRFGLEHKIKLIGYLPPEEVVKKLNVADVFVLTPFTPKHGEQEGIPNALKEAMATGLPVISTYHSGIPELVKDGVTGFLVEEKNVNAIAEKIMHLILNQDERYKMGKAASQFVRKYYDKAVINQKLIDIFYNLLLNHKSASWYKMTHKKNLCFPS